MAEIIGLAASLITLVGASAELARTLLKVANAIGSAEYEARLIAADILVFSCSLTQLSKLVELAHPETRKLREITAVLIKACDILISDLARLIGGPIPFHTTPHALLMPYLRLRFRWMMNGPKVLFLKSLVDSFKTTIILLVSTMDLATAIHGNAPNSIKECLETQVKSNITFAEDATETLMKCEVANKMQNSERTIEAPRAAMDDASSTACETETSLDSNSLLSITDVNEKNQLMLREDAKVDVHAHGGATGHEDYEHDEIQIQSANGCDTIVQIQKESCEMAHRLLQTPVVQRNWSWSGGQVAAETDVERSASRRHENGHTSSARNQRDQTLVDHGIKDVDETKPNERQSMQRNVIVDQRRVLNNTDGHTRLQQGVEDLEITEQQTMTGSRSSKQAHWSEDEESTNSHVERMSSPPTETDFMMKHDEQGGMEELTPSQGSANDQSSDEGVKEWRYTLPTDPVSDRSAHFSPNPFRSHQEYPFKSGVNSYALELPYGNPPPPPPDTAKEDSMLTKLEKLLLYKADEEEKAAEAAKKAAEDAKFDRLEKLLIAQQEAKIEKEKAKIRAAEEAARAAAEARKKGDEDKLVKLEKLILAQKDEQLKREAAIEAAQVVEKAEADATAARIAVEKKMAAERAKDLLDAARIAREEAENKAAREAEETKQAHEEALLQLRLVQGEVEKAHASALDEARKMERVQLEARIAKEPVIVEDIVGRKISCPWHACNTPEALKEFLRQNSTGVNPVLTCLEGGNYDMLKNDIVIPRQLWDDMIFPGSSLKMKARNPEVSLAKTSSITDQKTTDKKFKWHRSLRWDSTARSP